MRLTQVLRALRPPRSGQTGSTPGAGVSTGPRPILVGVDGTPAATRALEWAVIRAWAGHTSLHVVHALESRVWLRPEGLGVWWPTDPGEIAHRVLDQAIERAHELVPELSVTASLRGTSPSDALLDEGRGAELIVLGSRRAGLGRTSFRWRVTSKVVRQARGRVVMVGPDDEVLV